MWQLDVLIQYKYLWGVSSTHSKLNIGVVSVRLHVQKVSHVRLCGPHRLLPTRLFCPWDSPGKNSRAGCPVFLQGIFPTQGSNLLSLVSPASAGRFFTLMPPGKPHVTLAEIIFESQTYYPRLLERRSTSYLMTPKRKMWKNPVKKVTHHLYLIWKF